MALERAVRPAQRHARAPPGDGLRQPRPHADRSVRRPANSDSALVQGLLSFFPIMSGNVLLMLFSLGVMIYLSPLLAVVSVIIAPTLLIVSYRMRRRVFPATGTDSSARAKSSRSWTRTSTACASSRRSARSSANSSGWPTPADAYGSQMRAVRLQSRYQPLLEAIPTIGQVAILAFGGWLALQHEITLRHVPGHLHLHRPARRACPPTRRRPDHGPAGPGRDRADLSTPRSLAGHRRSPRCSGNA